MNNHNYIYYHFIFLISDLKIFHNVKNRSFIIEKLKRFKKDILKKVSIIITKLLFFKIL